MGTCRSCRHCQSLVTQKPGRVVEAYAEEWTGYRKRNSFLLQGPFFASTDKTHSGPAGKGEIMARPNFIIAGQAMRGEFGSETHSICNWHTGKTLWIT